MSTYFNNLNDDERAHLKEALPLIAVLIAGADGKFSEDELEWAKKIAHIRSYNLKGDLKAFYKEAEEDIIAKIHQYIEELPGGAHQRNDIIAEKLSALNPILEKIEQPVRYKLYKGFLTYAEHIAKASGGVLGFFGINAEEAKVVKLPMIHPVEYDDSEEEE